MKSSDALVYLSIIAIIKICSIKKIAIHHQITSIAHRQAEQLIVNVLTSCF